MKLEIEDLNEAYQVTFSLHRFLEWKGHQKGHATDRCGCSICSAMQHAAKALDELNRRKWAEMPVGK